MQKLERDGQVLYMEEVISAPFVDQGWEITDHNISSGENELEPPLPFEPPVTPDNNPDAESEKGKNKNG